MQVCGKVRTRVSVPADCPQDEAIAAAKSALAAGGYLDGKTSVKEICVPNKLVNIVAK